VGLTQFKSNKVTLTRRPPKKDRVSSQWFSDREKYEYAKEEGDIEFLLELIASDESSIARGATWWMQSDELPKVHGKVFVKPPSNAVSQSLEVDVSSNL
jgi:hypothetical protein